MKIDFKNNEYLDNFEYLNKINDLYIGKRNIDKNIDKYLTKHFKETKLDFEARAARANYENYVEKAIDNVNSMLYRKNISLEYKNKFDKFIKNIDGEGSSFSEFVIVHSRNAILDGMSFIWIDAPNFEDKQLTKYDVFSNNIFPKFKSIKRNQLINYDYKIINGEKILTQVVLVQNITKKINQFEKKNVEQFVVLNIGGGHIFERSENNKDEFIKVNKWENNLEYIPFVVTYSKKEGFLKADIPFLDLAELNLSLFNMQSDNNSILHKASVPILAVYGFRPKLDENGKEIPVQLGLNNGILFDDKSLNGVEYVTPDPSIIEVGDRKIDKLKDTIERFSLSVLSKFTFKTATEAKINDKNSSLFLVEISNSLEQTIINSFKIASDFIGEDILISVEMNRDFDNTVLSENMIDKIINLKNNGIISLDTVWDLLKKGEILDLEDYELEKKKIKEEFTDLDIEEKSNEF